MKKKILLIAILFFIVSLFYFQKSGKTDSFINQYLYFSVCSEPVLYKEGNIDPRFGLSKEEVIRASGDAAQIWNSESGFEVFRYSKDAKLSINMVYDQRQSLDTHIRNLEDNLESGKTTLDKETQNFNYQVDQFEQRNAEFQKKVDAWNENRGGTQEEYDVLIREQDLLQAEAEKLNQLSEKLNLNANKYNSQVDQFNQSIDTFNQVLVEKPEEGIYDPFKMEIDIYFNSERDKLVRTIAHELGHARGLGHTNSEKDMMYPITTAVLSLSEKDLELLDEICEPYFILEPYLNNIRNNVAYLRHQLIF